jgi:hypothetical protein
MMDFVNGKDDIGYMKWKITNVPHHQPVIFYLGKLPVVPHKAVAEVSE